MGFWLFYLFWFLISEFWLKFVDFWLFYCMIREFKVFFLVRFGDSDIESLILIVNLKFVAF